MPPATPRHALTIALLAALHILAGLPASTTAQVEPDDRCAATPPEPNVACTDATLDPEVAALIVWVMATDDGAGIYLTPEGIALGRTCDGAAKLATLASGLYAVLPEAERLRDDLLWANPALTREVYAHSWAATLGSDRGNPVDIVFSDYTGDPSSFQSRVYRSPILAAMCPG